MNKPSPKYHPSNFELKIVKFTAEVEVYADPPRPISEPERARLKKLKATLDKMDLEEKPWVKTFAPGETVTPPMVPKKPSP